MTPLKVFVCCFMLEAALYCQTPPPGSISGTIKTEDVKSTIAVVRAARVSPLPAVVSSVKSNPGGAYQITGLPAGTYELCITVPEGGYVDPCLWDASGVKVPVAAGQNAISNITIKKASVLKVHVEDPGKLIKNSRDGAILMGVIAGGGRFHPVSARGNDNNGNNYDISVPFDRDFRFIVHPVGLTVIDLNNGNAVIGNEQSLALKHSSNGNGPPAGVLNYRVTGKK